MLGKIDVNGGKTDPVYKYLKDQKSFLGVSRIKYVSFTKFLTVDGILYALVNCG